MRAGSGALETRYVEAFRRLDVIPFDREAARIFASLRAREASLRPPDAIQLACASVAGVDAFLTNDRRLSKVTVPGIARILALEDWESLFV